VKKPEKLGWKILCLAGFLLLLALWYIFDLPCAFRYVTGIPCITCGMTRAWTAALSGDLWAAFRQHPMFWSIPVLVVFLFYDGQIFPNRKGNILTLGLIVAGIFILYFARLFGFLGALSPL